MYLRIPNFSWFLGATLSRGKRLVRGTTPTEGVIRRVLTFGTISVGVFYAVAIAVVAVVYATQTIFNTNELDSRDNPVVGGDNLVVGGDNLFVCNEFLGNCAGVLASLDFEDVAIGARKQVGFRIQNTASFPGFGEVPNTLLVDVRIKFDEVITPLQLVTGSSLSETHKLLSGDVPNLGHFAFVRLAPDNETPLDADIALQPQQGVIQALQFTPLNALTPQEVTFTVLIDAVDQTGAVAAATIFRTVPLEAWANLVAAPVNADLDPVNADLYGDECVGKVDPKLAATVDVNEDGVVDALDLAALLAYRRHMVKC